MGEVEMTMPFARQTPPAPPSAVPLPRFAGEDSGSRPAAALYPPPFTGEGDHAKRGGGGPALANLRERIIDRSPKERP